ncbi:hypothetical protein DEU56DRAFT_751281 [Suillus clintonianus]|uniref:uncharacterized protein n=1 Tax=Suillus clintonianus TaxID=1904413 RepID=UPI001B85DF95|nr:uncharacterized protein DEU56DRAFT_751281 [Suillus clintonianus]KAG2154589.1 hypothetical protein DEU56DRAFT_751281 [Suillus clintonianus]
MNEDNPPSWKKRWGWLKSGRSDAHLPEERTASDSYSLLPSKNASRRRFSRVVPKFIGKVTNRSASSARQSPNPETTAASSCAPVLLHSQTSQVLSPLTTTTPELNSDQSSDLRIAKAEQPDPKLVRTALANAKAEFEGVKHVSGTVDNATSASDNPQSIPDTIDAFPAILGPLKVFNSVANGLADVRASISISYVADLRA